MDQAASVISLAGSALYISFFPRLSAQPIPLPGAAPITSTSPASAADADSALPPRAVFVCANSLVVSDKVVHARTRYNLRVVETLVSARVLARRLGISVGDKEKVTLREVLGRVVGEDVGKMEDMDLEVLKGALEKMVKEIEVLKPQGRDEEGVTMEEMIEWSGMSKDVFNEVYLSWVDSASHFPFSSSAPGDQCANDLWWPQSKRPASSCTSARSTSSQSPYASSNSATSASNQTLPPSLRPPQLQRSKRSGR